MKLTAADYKDRAEKLCLPYLGREEYEKAKALYFACYGDSFGLAHDGVPGDPPGWGVAPEVQRIWDEEIVENLLIRMVTPGELSCSAHRLSGVILRAKAYHVLGRALDAFQSACMGNDSMQKVTALKSLADILFAWESRKWIDPSTRKLLADRVRRLFADECQPPYHLSPATIRSSWRREEDIYQFVGESQVELKKLIQDKIL